MMPEMWKRVAAAALAIGLVGGAVSTGAFQEPVAPAPAPAAAIAGYWRGQLQVPGAGALTIGLTITRGADGQLTATLDSPDQGAMGIAMSAVSLTGDKFHADVPTIRGAFDAVLQPGATPGSMTLTGEWRQGLGKLPLTLERRDASERAAPKRPQEPRKPYPYLEEEVRYQNVKAGVTRAGTLTTPKASSPVPAVLLLTGSGPQDRDEALMGHRPFLVLADHLTRQGIAVLRVDDRGVGGSTGAPGPTIPELAEDAVAGVEFLKTRREIDPSRIGLVGHSEGGTVAPLAATLSRDVRFLVLLAGTGVTGEEILYAQGALIMRANGATEERVTRLRAQQEQLFAVLKQEPDAAVAETRLRAILEAAPETSGRREQIDGQVRTFLQPWFRALLTYDPQTALRKVTVPVLAINGEKDLQVPARENLAAIERGLKAAGNADVTTQILPGLNHLFQTATTGSPAEYARIEETFAPAALQAISDWILARVKKGA